jgi:virulence factor Mce-like protein
MSEFGGKKASVALGLAVVLAISAVATMVTIFSLGSGNNDYQVKVHFPTANGLIDGSDVLIGGVKVGTVGSVLVDNTPPADNSESNFANPTSTAVATVNIKRQYAPLHQGATVAIRPKSLLGEKYLAVTAGDPGKDAIPDGSTLPPESASVNVELDQLVNIFDEPTRKQLQKLIDSLGTGLLGQGRNTNETFQVGGQDLGNFSKLTDVLQARDAELKRVIDALNKITETLSSDQQRANYPDLLAHSDAVLKTLIAEDDDVQKGLDRFNAFFGILDAGFAGRKQDLQALLALLPRTVGDLDALALTMAPQGHVALGIAQQTAPGVIASDLIFGATPSKNTDSGNYTYTQNLFTRVMPDQGCFNVNTRTYDVNGFAHDTPPAIRRNPTANPDTGNPLCTTPHFFPQGKGTFGAGPCAQGTSGDNGRAGACGFALTGSLCVGFGFPSQQTPPLFQPNQGCNQFTDGKGGPYIASATAGGHTPASAEPQRGVLGLPLQQASTDNQAAAQFLGYLLQ